VYALDSCSKTQVLSTAAKIWKILKKERPDIVHAHLFYPSVLGLALARLQKIRTVLTRHHSDASHLLPSRLKRSFYLWLEKANNRRADHVIAPSKMVRQCIVDWEGTPEEKVSIIPYGQTSERFDAVTVEVTEQKREELGMNRQLSLACISRLFHRKGHKYLFEAFAPLIKHGLSAKLYLAGEGDFRESLEKMTADLGIAEHVEFLGWRNDGLQIIAAADIIVHPSLEDALSQSLIESLMLSKPIVATDISGATDTLDGGKYGKLVPPADSESFRVALAETIENLDSARENAKRGREYLLEYMDAKRAADEHVKIYRRVLDL
jgi:glycosyltransferase involved in cell wall biosynthesis